MNRKLYPICSYQRPRDQRRNLNVAQLRDADARGEIQANLLQRGFGYGEPILNHPPRNDSPNNEKLHEIDTSFVDPCDLGLATTRPAIHDTVHGDRKKILPACTDLEKKIFTVWRLCLEICARSHVRLSDAMAKLLPADFASRRDIAFKQNRGSTYKELNGGGGWRSPKSNNLTAAYLLYAPELWPGGPAFLNPFGMDATVTLAWCYRLARDFSHLLDAPGFAMVEIETKPLPERPTNLRWAFDWKIEPIIEVQF